MLVSHAKIDITDVDLCSVFDICWFNSYERLLRVTSRVVQAFRGRSFTRVFTSPTAEDLMNAEMLWVKGVQSKLDSDWKMKYRRLGSFLNESGLIVDG